MLSFSNNLITKGISRLISSEDGFAIHTVNEPSSLEEAIKSNPPDVLLVDFFVLVNHLPDSLSRTAILLLDTGCDDENRNYAFLTKKIAGLIKINSDERLLIKAIRSVREGQLWIDNRTTKGLISILSELTRLWHLTNREVQILCMLGRGMDDKLISGALDLNDRTVRGYVDNLIRKIGVRNRRDLTRLSLQFSECFRSGN